MAVLTFYDTAGRQGRQDVLALSAPAPRAAPCVWRLAYDAMENAREVRLIAHAASDRNRAEGLGGGQHQPLGHLNAPSQHIVARRCPKRTFERTAEVAGTEAHEPCQLVNENPSG